jgi:hypothetical protein
MAVAGILPIADRLGLEPDEVEPYGRFKAKVNPRVLERLAAKPNGKYTDGDLCNFARLRTRGFVPTTRSLFALATSAAGCHLSDS